MQAWVQEELQTVDIGDERLDARFKVVLDRLSAKPSVSIPAACGGWTETNATYRFFRSRRVEAKDVLAPHYQATLKRIAEQSVVLIPQDTTEIEVTRPEQQMTGAGPLNDESRLGFYDHVLLAVTPDRIPLGVIQANTWARDLEEFRRNQRAKEEDPRAKAKKDRERPIEEKESRRWLEGYRRACAVAEQCPDTQIVAISDSEGDVYECFEEATRRDGQKKADWIVRACQNRGLCGAYPQVYRRLREQVASTRVLGTMEVEVHANTPKIPSDRKRNQPRSARTATVTIRATRVKLRGPQRPGGRARDVELNAILVREEDPPRGEEPLEWLLLTSLPIKSFKQVCRVIEYYCCRWEIEIYFRVLKSGCKVEERQFEDAERYLPCLALYMVVAWRVMYVMMMGRECPEMSCAEILSEDEWKAVYTVVRGESLPEEPPTLGEMVTMIARLGGHLGRTHDGPPGPKAMWIGMQRMMDLALAWRTFGPGSAAGRRRKKCV
jgi:hypothetical protein